MDKNEFKDIFDSPKTIGEKVQVEKIKTYSKDPDEVIKIKQKLEKLGLKQELLNFNSPINFKKDLQPIRIPKKVHYKRREDEFEFPIKKAGFLKKLVWIFTKSNIFKYKYPDTKLVKTSFISLILFGNCFILGNYVQKFLLEYIINWQELFKPVLKIIYKSGWRNKIGKLILTPKEFNILGTCERLANERGITEILFKPKNTIYIYNKSSLFFNYYYQIIQAGTKNLISSFIKAMQPLAGEDNSEQFRNEIEGYCTRIFNFFDNRVENSFIIPILEAMTGEALIPEKVKANSKITLLETKEYRAHERLRVMMKSREEKYNNKIKKIIRELEIELVVLEPISKDIQFKYQTVDRYYSPIEIALNAMGKEDSDHCIKHISTVIEFFDKYYAPVLTMRVPIRMEGSIEYAEIFTKEVFSESYSKIIELKKEIENYMTDPFSECIKLDPSKESYTINQCIITVSKICDQLFNIGKKLYKSSSSIKLEKTSFRPIDPITLGKINIPYYDRTIYSENKENAKYEFSLNGKNVKQVLEEIRIFCMYFVISFEPPFRYILEESENKKKKTLYIRIIEKEEIKTLLEKFKNGENIDNLLQSYL